MTTQKGLDLGKQLGPQAVWVGRTPRYMTIVHFAKGSVHHITRRDIPVQPLRKRQRLSSVRSVRGNAPVLYLIHSDQSRPKDDERRAGIAVHRNQVAG